MTKLNIKEIQKEFPKRGSILAYHTKKDHSEIYLAEEWLEKWCGRYKIIGGVGCEDADYDYHMLCKEDAYEAIPNEIKLSGDWDEKGIPEYVYSEEEYLEANALEEYVEPEPYEPLKLKKPLTLIVKEG